MIYRISTGLQESVLDGLPLSSVKINSNTVSFTTDQILDTGNMGGFARHDFVLVKDGVNAGVKARVISGDSDQLTFASGTFTPESAGSFVVIEKVEGGGSYSKAMINGKLHIYSSPMPLSADDAEGGAAVLLATLTRNAMPFTPGVSENGINLAWDAAGSKLVRAIDPETGIKEVWSGEGVAVGTASWGRHYDNNAITGQSTTAKRIDGNCGDTPDSFFYMPGGRSIVVGSNVIVTSIKLTLQGVS